MATHVVITGSGTPLLVAGRAGPGTLVRTDTTTIQIDAGRATALRLAEARVPLPDIDAVLITHHHSDHLLGLTDLLLARWMANGVQSCPPLPVHCPAGPAADFVGHLFDHLEPDIRSRLDVSGYPDRPEPLVLPFQADGERFHVTTIGDVLVEGALVEHGDLAPAVGFRLTTPDGVIVVSGDTTVCPALESVAEGCDVLVQEAFSSELLLQKGAPPDRVANLGHHHADARQVGEMAARLAVPTLVLTHMIPSPTNEEQVQVFRSAVRSGGYEGELTIAEDLASVTI